MSDALSVGVLLSPEGGLRGPATVAPSRVRVSHKLTYDDADALLESEPPAGARAGAGGPSLPAEARADLRDLLRAAQLRCGGLRAGMHPLTNLPLTPPQRPSHQLLNAQGRHTARTPHAADKPLPTPRIPRLPPTPAPPSPHRSKSHRESRGCIEIPLPEAKLSVPPEQLDAARPAVSLRRVSQWESASRGLVAECMIAAGEAVGALGEAEGWQGVTRRAVWGA